MKIIIIDDSYSEGDGIGNYALDLAKYLETSVQIVHIIDSRVSQGVPSSVADSSTITGGNKMTHAQILKRDEFEVSQMMNTYWRRKLSSLNFPLKHEFLIRSGTILEELQSLVDPKTLLIINERPDGKIFQSREELGEVVNRLDCLKLLIPENFDFRPFSHLLIPIEFSDHLFSRLEALAYFLSNFHFTISGLGPDKTITNSELKQWSRKMDKLFTPISVQTRMLDKNHFDDHFIDYVNIIEPDLSVIVNSNRGFWTELFSKDLTTKSIASIRTPFVVI